MQEGHRSRVQRHDCQSAPTFRIGREYRITQATLDQLLRGCEVIPGWVWLLIGVGYVFLVFIILRGFHVLARVYREWDRQAADRRG